MMLNEFKSQHKFGYHLKIQEEQYFIYLKNVFRHLAIINDIVQIKLGYGEL